MGRTVRLEDLVDRLGSIPAGEFTDDRVLATVSDLRISKDSLDPYVTWKPDRYTRNLVFRNELFEVIVLCWNVGQSTPVHDHAGQRCWMLVEEGRLEITDVAWNRGRAPRMLGAEVVGRRGGGVHVDRCACVHQIANRCAWGEPAVSVHVYSRPVTSCYLYDLASGTRERIDLAFDTVGPLVDARVPS